MNRFRPLMLATLAALVVLGFSDTASAQPQLIITPSTATNQNTPLIFNNIPGGGVSPPQAVTVSTVGNTMATVIVQASPSAPWLVVLPNASVNIPSSLSVKCNTAGLTSGTYNGSFTITVDGAPSDQVTVYVALTVSGSSQLYSTPPNLTFTSQTGSNTGNPASTSVQILSSGSPLNYTLQAQTTDGHNWLLLSATQGSTSGNPFTVSVNPSSLSANSFPAIFNGLITASSTTTLDAVQISVQLTLTSTASVSVSPTNPPPFLYQVGTLADPPSQQLSVSSTGGSTTFSVQENPPVSWLVVNPLSGIASSTPAIITLNPTPHEQALQPSTYTTSIVVTPSGQVALPAVPVTLVVAANPLLQLSTNSLSFTAPFAGASPPTQSVTISAANSASVGFSVSSSASWLSVSQTGSTTPATLTVQVNPTGLSVQNYSGTLTITPTNGDQYTETIAVTFTIAAAAQMIAGPPNLLFSYQIGQQPPPSQTIALSSTGQSIQFNITSSTTNCGQNWLGATPSSPFTNATLNVSVVTTGMTAGFCSGTITLSYASGLGPATLPINVTVAVSNSAELSINTAPGFGVVTAALNSATFLEQISLTSTDPTTPVSYSAAVTGVTGGAWLGFLGSTSGTTPQNLMVQIVPAAVSTAGTYIGNVVISSSSLASSNFSIPITLTATSTTTVSVAPTALSFTENQGGSVPAAQTLTLTSSPTVASYTAVIASITGGNWLQISPTSGSANGAITATVLPNTLSPGDYPAQISFAYQNSSNTSATVSVTLHVLATQSVAVSSTSLAFAYQAGVTTPSPQQFTVTSTGGSVPVSIAVASGVWLSVDNKGGATPQTVNVSVTPPALSTLTFNGSTPIVLNGAISVSATGVLANPISVPVTLTISPPPPPQPVVIINNATGAAGIISAGEEIAIKGNFLGPSTPANGVLFSLNSAGGVDSTLAGVTVTFDNNAGTPIYVSASQLNIMVPYEINGRISTTMVVTYNGVSSQPFQLSVASAAPGLFTNNFSGRGQVAALNQDLTYNGSGTGFSAAPRGSVISLYGTGGGQTSPISLTGTVSPADPNKLLYISNVTATVGGLPATVLFAGAAPGEVTGVMQINVQIPAGVTPGNAVPIAISIGTLASPAGTTIAVQ